MNALRVRAVLPGMLLRLILGAALSIALAWWAGPTLARAYLPILHWAYSHVDTDNDVVSLVVADRGVNHGDDRVYVLTISPHPYIYVGERLVATNTQGRGYVSVLTGYLWQPFVIALPFVLAWPVRRHTEWGLRAVSLLAVGTVVLLLDLPTLLWSEVWSYYVGAVEPGNFSVLLHWGHLLKNGGQTLLGLCMAALTVGMAAALHAHLSRDAGNARALEA